MLKRLEITGFKSFARKTALDFSSATTAIVGPNGSGKSNVAEAFRFALGEQSMKSMRGKRSEDLIWGGSHAIPRANRAAVAVTFDNSKRVFKIDFDEVTIERAVFRDGSSEYSINGSKVRLRDIDELLAGANIGETGHHIISQGEADRILLSNPRERRSILEDALGLKVYEFKKQEAEKKLEKTEENINQVNGLRKELTPHLRFLEKQVEKLDRTEHLRSELATVCQTFFAIEDLWLTEEGKKIENAKNESAKRLKITSAELAHIEESSTTDAEGAKRLADIRAHEEVVEKTGRDRSELLRDIGRVEGALSAAKQRSIQVAKEPYAKISREDLYALRQEVEKQAEEVSSVESLQATIKSIRSLIRVFVERFVSGDDNLFAEEERAAHVLEVERETLMEKDKVLARAHDEARSALQRARESMTAHDEAGREMKRRILDLAQSKAKEESAVIRCDARLRELKLLSDELERTKAEALALAGSGAVSYSALESLPEEERCVQEDRKKRVERSMIRLEEAGGTSEDIREEYKDVSERESFLTSEIEDLSKSAAGLRTLIDDLNTELAKHFSEGLAKVNASFGEYFGLMFGGGGARLILEDAVHDEDELMDDEPKKTIRAGIEISVHLPKKKVQSLIQLSGGERALTSIALIFAMSQVNPPPFLILDETDAALDEANSRRYGDMIENLAKKSQLIVITHNRESMSRAGILYGVTMGNDGVSKLLSVKFEEAVQVAK